MEVKKGKKVARLNAATAREPPGAPSKNRSRGWGPLKEYRKQQPALQIDDHALRARGTVADFFMFKHNFLSLQGFSHEKKSGLGKVRAW